MGGFHMIMCMMKCIYSRFKGFGFPEFLSEVGVGGSGTIENALKGGDVKAGIRYYKILFEAIFRIRIEASGIFDSDDEHVFSLSRIKELNALRKSRDCYSLKNLTLCHIFQAI